MAELVSWEKNGPVAMVTFGQPTADAAFIASFVAAVDKIEADDDIRIILIKGAPGKIFFSGYDISLMEKEVSSAVAKGSIQEVQWLMDRIEQCSIPVLAVIDGFALGGGFEMALACDLVYASERALFGTPEVKIGLIPAAGGVMRLPRLVGKQKAMEMILTGRIYSAQQTLELGIVNAIFPHDELLDQVIKITNEIVDNSPIAVKAAKRTILNTLGLFDKQLELMIVEENYKCTSSEDIKEGVKAFFEKRKPQFKGK